MERKQPFLFERFPRLKEHLPWTSLGSFPTPVHRLEKLGAKIGHGGLFVKRDDLSATEYGGNKVRKLEFTLADAKKRGRAAVITMGAIGSNHVLATTIHGRKLGLATVGMFLPQAVRTYAKDNIRCNYALGCGLQYFPTDLKAMAMLPGLYYRTWRERGGRPYFLWAGGSSPLGVIGYVEAAFEIAAQVREGLIPEPDYVFVPAGSTGTAAGLHLGLALAGLKSRAWSVRVYDRSFANEGTTAFLARQALKRLRKMDNDIPSLAITADNVRMLHDQFGPGYAEATPESRDAIAMMKELEDIKLDGAYSGKAMAGFIQFMTAPGNKERTGLFINTYNSRPLDPYLASCPPPDGLAAPFREFLEQVCAEGD